MGQSKVVPKATKSRKDGRTHHSFVIKGGNGEKIVSSPSRQAYYNLSDMENSLKVMREAIDNYFSEKALIKY